MKVSLSLLISIIIYYLTSLYDQVQWLSFLKFDKLYHFQQPTREEKKLKLKFTFLFSFLFFSFLFSYFTLLYDFLLKKKKINIFLFQSLISKCFFLLSLFLLLHFFFKWKKEREIKLIYQKRRRRRLKKWWS